MTDRPNYPANGKAGLTNPAEAAHGFRRQVIFHMHFWALLAAAPLIIVQWEKSHPFLSFLLLLFCLSMTAVILRLRISDRYLFRGWLFPIFAIACVVYSTLINGYIGLVWTYPCVAAIFFLLSQREAVPINAVFIVAICAVSYYRFPEPEFWRITFSLLLTGVFTAIFAWIIGRMQHDLTQLATIDPLTQCYNRAQLADELNRHIQMRERYERVTSLILLDLDHFKAINDQWGHAKGDRVLVETAGRLQNRLRDNDLVFRIGGEEFLIILPETRQRQAEKLADDLLLTLSQNPVDEDITVTASAGVTEVVRGETWSTWLNRADQALYTAKQTGRDRVVSRKGDPAVPMPRPMSGNFAG